MTFAEGTSAILKINFSLHRQGYFKLQNCASGVISADWTMPVHDAGEIHAGSWEENPLKSCNYWLKHDAYNTAKNKVFGDI
jgi:hypothetical protein